MIQNNFVMDKLRLLTQTLQSQMTAPAGDVGPIKMVLCGYKTSNTPPAEGWQPFGAHDHVQGADAHAWFRMAFRTPPAAPHQTVWLHVETSQKDQWDAHNPQGLVYLNGVMTQGLDINRHDVLLTPDTEYTVHVYFYTGSYDFPVEFHPSLIARDTRIESLYYDFLVPYEACQCVAPDSEAFARMTPVLEQAANRIRMQRPLSDEYFASLAEASEYLKTEFYGKLCGNSTAVVDCIGHTHIDVAWLWTLEQTREKTQRSFCNMLRLMEQYPEFRFMSSQPQLYQYLKQEAPEVYAEVKRRAAEGRWEVEGAMWLEADCNLISGESMVRQILHGKKFMKDEFGVDSHILWLPDVFGYSAAMPQILKKCGVDQFVTSKISWNETNRMPVDTFMWQGIDGTEIRADFLTEQAHDDPGHYATYVGKITPSHVLGTWKNYQQKEYNNETLITFGFGDGGGGSTREMLEYQRRMQYGLPGFPRTQICTAAEHLKNVWKNMEENAAKIQRMPKWIGELYLELHRGTYTSIAKNKRNNRKSELLLQKAEGLSATAALFGGSYPAQPLYSAWESVLLHQFHDIIPGSSIKPVYDESDAAYANIRQTGESIVADQLDWIANRVDAQDGVLVYNPLGFAQGGTISVNGQTAEIGEIPAMGWTVLHPEAPVCAVTLGDQTAENEFYRLTLDDSGRIASLFDKTAEREVFRAGCAGNELQIFEDFPRQYDAWEITNYYKQKMTVLDDPAQITPVTDGSRAGFRIVKKYYDSTICQTIWLYSANRRIDVENEIDWHEHHQLLKAAFPFDLHATKATYEIQFGHLERPTTENTTWEAAKFEVCGHKWADMSENGYGVSLLNDCKYGFSAEENTMKLTLLKCATYPNPEADQGHHTFTYSLLPHDGDFRDAHTIREAYRLNQPLMTTALHPHDDTSMPAAFSLVQCDCENVVIDTVKQAEDGDRLIVRLYEAFDRRSRAALRFGFDVASVTLCDMLEQPEQELPVTDNTVTLPVRNFEIVTLRVKRA